MNKTVNANIGGLIFHIDEDAFQKMNRYLDTLKSYFRKSDGNTEIMDDIEARIAELLQERMGAAREIVNMEDVDHVMTAMGQPEDFEDTSAEPGEKQESSQEPEAEIYTRVNKRLFRNPDDKVLGGVCSGISAYFNIDPIWLRLAFVISVIIFGTGILIYIILWVIIPAAKTTSEKLQMRGERVTITNIQKSVKEELDNLGNQIKDFGKDIKKNFKGDPGYSRRGNGIEGFFRNLGNFVVSIAKLIFKFIAVILVIIGFIILISVMLGLFGVTSALTISWPFISHIIFENNMQALLAYLSIGLLLIIPVLWIIVRGMMALLSIKRSRYLNVSFFSAWIIALILTCFVGLQLGYDLKSKSSVKSEYIFQSFTGDTLYLDINKDIYLSGSGYEIFNEDDIYIDSDYFNYANDSLYLQDIKFRTRTSTDSFYSLDVYYMARGNSRKEAKERAENITYNVELRDSVLLIDPYFRIGDEPWRHQHVEMVLRIPEKKTTVMTEELVDFLNRKDDFHISHNNRWH